MSKKLKQSSLPLGGNDYPALIKKEEFVKASKEADRVLRLYPPVIRRGQSFEKAKKVVVPNQSLTLKEILKRFIRKEALAIGREGVYNDSVGDLEKMANLDITEKMDIVDNIKSGLAKAEEQKKAKANEEAKAKADAEFSRAVQDAAQKLQQSDPGQRKD